MFEKWTLHFLQTGFASSHYRLSVNIYCAQIRSYSGRWVFTLTFRILHDLQPVEVFLCERCATGLEWWYICNMLYSVVRWILVGRSSDRLRDTCWKFENRWLLQFIRRCSSCGFHFPSKRMDRSLIWNQHDNACIWKNTIVQMWSVEEANPISIWV